MSVRLVLALAFIAAIGCGGGDGGTPQEQTVTVTGRLINIGLDGTCAATVDDVSGTQITFRNGNGDVVGTTEAGQATEKSAENEFFSGCGRTANYSVEVSREDFYVVEALDVELDPISFQNLKAQGFEYDIELGGGLDLPGS
jgi:hypothetical protein